MPKQGKITVIITPYKLFYTPDSKVVVSSDTFYFDTLKQNFIDRFFKNKESVEECQDQKWYCHNLIVTALGISANHTLKYKYSEEILNIQNYNRIKPGIICMVLEILSNSSSIQHILNKILSGEYMNEEVFFTALKTTRSKELALFYIKRQNYVGIKLPKTWRIEYKNLLLSLSVLQEIPSDKPKEIIQLRKLILDYPYSSNDKKEKYHNQINKKFYDLLLEWNEISFDFYKKMVIDISFEQGANNFFDLYDYLELNFFDEI